MMYIVLFFLAHLAKGHESLWCGAASMVHGEWGFSFVQIKGLAPVGAQ